MGNQVFQEGFTSRIAKIVSSNRLLKSLAFDLLVEEELNNQEIQNFRKGRCDVCQFRNVDICGVCKCVLEIKQASKTNRNIYNGNIEITHCPMGFWDDGNLMTYYNQLNKI